MANPFIPSDFSNPSSPRGVRDDAIARPNHTFFPPAFILRAAVLTSVAWISTAAAINAQPTLHNNLALRSGTPNITRPNDWPMPVAIPKSYAADQILNLLALNSGKPVVLNQTDWPNPSPPVSPLRADEIPTRSALNSGPPVVLNQTDWPSPGIPLPPIRVDAILNPDPGFLLPVATPFAPNDWPLSPQLPPALALRPGGVMHRPQFVPGSQPPFQTELFAMAPRLPSIVTELTRNGILLPLPGTGVPFAQSDWPLPVLRPPTPQTWLFYYIQDQTAPSFIQYDWPLPARVPSLTADPIPNRLLYPFVAAPAPFRQQDWPPASTVQVAKIVDPYNRNVFLPPPQGQPGHQADWPLPQGPIPSDIRAGSSKRFAGFTDTPPHCTYDWPLPARPLYVVDLASWSSKRFAALQDVQPFNLADWPLPLAPVVIPDVRSWVLNTYFPPPSGLLVTGKTTIVLVATDTAAIVQVTTGDTFIVQINTATATE